MGSTSESTENMPPTTTAKSSSDDSSRVVGQPNRTQVDPTEIGCELVNQVDSWQSQKLIEEHWGSTETTFSIGTQGEPVGRRQLAKQGSKSDSNEVLVEEVEQEPIAPNGCKRYPLRERRPPGVFQIKCMCC